MEANSPALGTEVELHQGEHLFLPEEHLFLVEANMPEWLKVGGWVKVDTSSFVCHLLCQGNLSAPPQPISSPVNLTELMRSK